MESKVVNHRRQVMQSCARSLPVSMRSVSMRSYFGRWLCTAFKRAIGLFDLWASVISMLLSILDHYWPQSQIITKYQWQIPIWMLGGVILVRLLLAPYWMAKEDAEKLSAEKRISEQLKSKLVIKDQQRRAVILDKPLGEYVATRDNVPIRVIAGTEPMPPEWVNQRLKEMGETWRV